MNKPKKNDAEMAGENGCTECWWSFARVVDESGPTWSGNERRRRRRRPPPSQDRRVRWRTSINTSAMLHLVVADIRVHGRRLKSCLLGYADGGGIALRCSLVYFFWCRLSCPPPPLANPAQLRGTCVRVVVWAPVPPPDTRHRTDGGRGAEAPHGPSKWPAEQIGKGTRSGVALLGAIS